MNTILRFLPFVLPIVSRLAKSRLTYLAIMAAIEHWARSKPTANPDGTMTTHGLAVIEVKTIITQVCIELGIETSIVNPATRQIDSITGIQSYTELAKKVKGL